MNTQTLKKFLGLLATAGFMVGSDIKAAPGAGAPGGAGAAASAPGVGQGAAGGNIGNAGVPANGTVTGTLRPGAGTPSSPNFTAPDSPVPNSPNLTPPNSPNLTSPNNPNLTSPNSPNLTSPTSPNLTPTNSPNLTPSNSLNLTPSASPNLTSSNNPNVFPRTGPGIGVAGTAPNQLVTPGARTNGIGNGVGNNGFIATNGVRIPNPANNGAAPGAGDVPAVRFNNGNP